MSPSQLQAYIILLAFVAGALFVASFVAGEWVWAGFNAGSVALLIHYLEELT